MPDPWKMFPYASGQYDRDAFMLSGPNEEEAYGPIFVDKKLMQEIVQALNCFYGIDHFDVVFEHNPKRKPAPKKKPVVRRKPL